MKILEGKAGLEPKLHREIVLMRQPIVMHLLADTFSSQQDIGGHMELSHLSHSRLGHVAMFQVHPEKRKELGEKLKVLTLSC